MASLEVRIITNEEGFENEAVIKRDYPNECSINYNKLGLAIKDASIALGYAEETVKAFDPDADY